MRASMQFMTSSINKWHLDAGRCHFGSSTVTSYSELAELLHSCALAHLYLLSSQRYVVKQKYKILLVVSCIVVPDGSFRWPDFGHELRPVTRESVEVVLAD